MPTPVLGIMTLYLNDKKQLEERPIYERMITEGQKLDLEAFVFTPADVSSSKKAIYAMVFDPVTKKWSRKWRSFPDMIFDRCRIQRSVRFEQLKKFRAKYGHLNFLNRPLSDKWTIYQSLRKKAAFKPHLPETLLFNSLSDVYQLLKKNRLIYIKPAQGTGGRGILRVEKVGAKLYMIQGRNLQRKIISPRKMHESSLGPYLLNWRKGNSFLVQQGIRLVLPNGRVHDYRMLVQKSGSGKWSVTGCAGRVGAARSVTSNLHGGGQAVAMSTLLKQWIKDEKKQEEIKKKAEQLGVEIAEYLESQYSALCELALDLAINKSGQIYVLEVNPKPSREVFSQIGDTDAYHNAIIRPLEYALWVYQQKDKEK
ncbi:ATP-binding protein [Paenibacillus sp. CAA11]|uniref:YheC/YheD family endospore coat-associated protein n=1 Tax=Paenibacillus sp. CAA11 TaxID=1532905 RepID=UPI000D3C8F67|nr:YheC/YheD family protein [Paenibacillus sp. CAA11]AWB44046.1 ATP-binding protein [Paenibacillus sp. CAA11]